MSTHGPACACCTTQLIPTFNAKKRAPNPLRADPSRTAGLRRRFIAEINRHFAKLRREIRQLVVTEDAFGLEKPKAFALTGNADRQRWRFLTDDKKVSAFAEWLQGQMDAGLLALTGDKHWSQAYVESAYKQGVIRAWIDTNKKELGLGERSDFYAGSRAQFLRQSFGGPESLSKFKLLATRSYEGLRGVSSQMSATMARTLANGLANGYGLYQVANELSKATSMPIARARTIARTEIMHAHAEGQLDSFEALGVEELGVLAEWSTAGDNLVCPLCAPLEGMVLTIKEARGKIPRHPNCRCTWIPANVSEKESGQKRTKSRIKAAIKKSLKKETKAKTDEQAKARSTWAGADLTPSTKSSQYE